MGTEIGAQDRFIEINGLRLHYVEWGNEGAPPLVLLHGLTSHARSWDHLARALCDRFRIVALDQRGHGDSAWPADHSYRTEDYVADLAAFVEAPGFARFALVGLSMGAHNAIAFAAAHPRRVTHLVAIDIPPMFNRPPQPADGQPPRVFASVEEAFQHARSLNPRPREDVQRERVRWGLKERTDGRFELKYDPDAPRHWQPADLWQALPQIPCPTLIIRGAESQVLSAEVAERMAAAFPKARLETVEGSGHPVPLDRPEDLERLVREFLLVPASR